MSSMHCCADIRKKWSNLFLFFIAALLLAGCGGGGGGGGSSSPAASTLSGVAAVGTPIVNGNINIICAAGGALAPAITSSSGSWQVTLSGQTLPCAVQVSGGTINGVANTTPYHSIAITTGTVNITPLTDLTVANLIGTATPNTWFAGLSANPSPLTTITQTQVDTALTNLSTALSVIPLFTSTTNPITTDFTPNAGNILDDMLTALQAAMASTNTNYSSLLSNASANGFTAPAGFGSAMTTAFMGTATVKNTTFYPVNAPITALNATSISLTLTGTYNGNSIVYSVANTQGTTSQLFLGKAANISNSIGYIIENGNTVSSFSSTNYFSLSPYKDLGSSSTDAYTVYANQTNLPTIATIGMSGSLDTGTDYSDSTRSTILDTFVETWSLIAGPKSGTAYLCEKTVYTAVASSGTSGTSTTCLNIDTNGKILGVQLTTPINGTTVTFSSTSIVTTPPTVISTSPINASNTASIDTDITATFSEAVDPSTLTAATFTLSAGSGGAVTGTVTFSDGIATFTPAAPLVSGTVYTATISTGVKDLVGDPMSANYIWTFLIPYNLSGTVTGLTGSMGLYDGNGNSYGISSNGPFIFTSPYYSYTGLYVGTQPNGQACSINSKNVLSSGSIINVTITCLTGYYVVTPRIYGLNGTIVLQDNLSDNLTVTSNGAVAQGFFATSLPYGVPHNVTILTQPTGQVCNVSNGTSINWGDDVNVFCN